MRWPVRRVKVSTSAGAPGSVASTSTVAPGTTSTMAFASFMLGHGHESPRQSTIGLPVDAGAFVDGGAARRVTP